MTVEMLIVYRYQKFDTDRQMNKNTIEISNSNLLPFIAFIILQHRMHAMRYEFHTCIPIVYFFYIAVDYLLPLQMHSITEIILRQNSFCCKRSILFSQVQDFQGKEKKQWQFITVHDWPIL